MFCRDNHKQFLEGHLTGHQTERESEEDRAVESEMKAMQHSWGSLMKLALDRQMWRDFVGALNTTGCNGSSW